MDCGDGPSIRQIGCAPRLRRRLSNRRLSRPRSRRMGARHRGQPDRHVPFEAAGGKADGAARRWRKHHQCHLAARRGRPPRACRLCRLEGSKGGGRSLTHAMALELAPHGIRVNAIAPGPTLTGLTRANYSDPERRRATIAPIPLGRMGQPEDIVGAILFLASDDRDRQLTSRRQRDICIEQRRESRCAAPAPGKHLRHWHRHRWRGTHSLQAARVH